MHLLEEKPFSDPIIFPSIHHHHNHSHRRRLRRRKFEIQGKRVMTAFLPQWLGTLS